MKIQIICDQKDCIHNECNHVHHDHENDICTHPHPAIQRFKRSTIEGNTTCNSKATKQWDNPLPPSCEVCESNNLKDCLNCCHRGKTIMTMKDLKSIDDNNE